MKKKITVWIALLWLIMPLYAQVEPDAGTWKTWFIPSGKTYRLPPPPTDQAEIKAVIARQEKLDAAAWQQILYWNAGAPGYRWQDMVDDLWHKDTSYNGALANMLLSVATYDATVAAWDSKYVHQRKRPFDADRRIKLHAVAPDSPSYPCEHAVAAGVAVAIITHFFPAMTDSVQRMAQQVMDSRIAAGVAFPSDTRAGFELGKKIAEKEIEYTRDFTPQMAWDGKMPQQPGLWKGKPMFPMAGLNRTVVLDSSSQFRPGPPPDFAKDMEELKKFKPTFRSTANAFQFAAQSFWEESLHKMIFEYNLHVNPPRAARIYAIKAVTVYDGFAACWDAKYTYWGTRPDQYDPSFKPVLFHTPPFPGYPSGHAAISGALGELYAYFFPAEGNYFRKKARDAAESRFQGGIHFRTDNEVGLELGRKVGEAVIKRAKADGVGESAVFGKTGKGK